MSEEALSGRALTQWVLDNIPPTLCELSGHDVLDNGCPMRKPCLNGQCRYARQLDIIDELRRAYPKDNEE
jgi:hypothetical protein